MKMGRDDIMRTKLTYYYGKVVQIYSNYSGFSEI